MSVQLIVYPQNYDGTFNSISGNSSQMAANPTNFTNALTTLANYSATSTITQVAVNSIASTMSPNAWYGFVNITTSALIAATNNMLIMSYIDVGVLQKLTNLTVGSVYNVTLTFDAVGSNPIDVKIFNGTTFVSSATASPSALTATVQFTAPSVNNTIFCLDCISSVVAITSVSITSAAQLPSGAIQIVEDGQVICDLYEDEDLPLTLSVDDFKNVAEKVQSYSKAFKLPATKRNNRIFDHIFEITREVASAGGLLFNPYKRTKCVLKQDGFILFEGYLRLLDVIDKEGEISYSVNLYSEVIALADTLKDRAFSDLDFSELEHEYNYTNIVLSETGNLALTNPLPVGSFAGSAGSTITNVVRYPFVDWNHQYTITSGGMPKLLTLESSFRPFISIKYLIDRIFDAPNTPFTYESAFFDTTDFKKLYMDFNWGSNNTPNTQTLNNFNSIYVASSPGSTTPGNNYATTSFDVMELGETYSQFPSVELPPNYNSSTFILTSTVLNEKYTVNYNYLIQNTDTVAREIECRWLYNTTPIDNTPTIGSASVITIPAGGVRQYNGQFTRTLTNIGDTLQAQFRTNTGTASKVRQRETILTEAGAQVIWSYGIGNISSGVILQTLRGELGQWDFLKGLITMFNLVTLVDEDNPNNIIIEPYSDVFIPTATGGTTLANRGIQHDWTDKIDVSEMKLTPLTDLNKKTIFKFAEDEDDYAFNQYKSLVGGHLYGSYLSDAGNEFNILDGEDEIIAEPFAATVVKSLMSQYPDFITPAIYTMGEDGVSEGFENSPRIMYNNGQKTLSSNTFSVPAQNGSPANASANKFLQFSHLSELPTSSAVPSTTIDFHFGECQLMSGVGVATPNNLFGLYWLPYYSELYNPNTRTMTIKVNLSPADINTFRFNDRVFIKNRVFRVNKIDYKPNDLATVEFILIP